jgi:hypothetical protein
MQHDQRDACFDPAEITHTARCDHLCAFCGMTVRTGERYVRAQSPGGAQAKKPFHSACYAG